MTYETTEQQDFDLRDYAAILNVGKGAEPPEPIDQLFTRLVNEFMNEISRKVSVQKKEEVKAKIDTLNSETLAAIVAIIDNAAIGGGLVVP